MAALQPDPAPLSFDIFCRVVDNFGDAGVCWRLARQLAAAPHNASVRLWIDDRLRLAAIEPRLQATVREQCVDGVSVRHWGDACADVAPHDVIIEAFACEPPASFGRGGTDRKGLWINLEYLSAEAWVDSFHGQPSLQADGRRKFFFFPGFTAGTGGLLREPGLLQARDAWNANPANRAHLLHSLGLASDAVAALLAGQRQVLLFCYAHAPAAQLVGELAHCRHGATVLVPKGVCPSLPRGLQGNVNVIDMPFVDQAGFDRLLWSSDLNAVRGEDSLLRGLWAGKPMLWHIYPQQELAHWPKLQAWLERSGLPCAAMRANEYWNADGSTHISGPLLPPENEWPAWEQAMHHWAASLARQESLATRLMRFCTLHAVSG